MHYTLKKRTNWQLWSLKKYVGKNGQWTFLMNKFYLCYAVKWYFLKLSYLFKKNIFQKEPRFWQWWQARHHDGVFVHNSLMTRTALNSSLILNICFISHSTLDSLPAWILMIFFFAHLNNSKQMCWLNALFITGFGKKRTWSCKTISKHYI